MDTHTRQSDSQLFARVLREQRMLAWEVFKKVYGYERSEEFKAYIVGGPLPDKVRIFCEESL